MNDKNFDEILGSLSWDNLDENDFLEFVQFDEVSPFEALAKLYDEKVEVLLAKINWDSLETFKNQWNKTQHRVQIQKYVKTMRGNGKNRYYEYSLMDLDFYLAMGKRLLGTMQKFHQDNTRRKNVKILRIGEGFQTRYFIEEFNPNKQAEIDNLQTE